MNLNEEKYLPLFKDLKLNGQDMNSYVEGLYRVAVLNKSQDMDDINWLKIGISLNNKHLVDAAFTHIGVTEQSVKEAVEYAVANKSEINIKIMDRVAENIVSEKYNQKHQSTDSEDSSYKKLNPLEYLTERIKDVFQKRTDVNERIAQMRETLNNSPSKSATI